MSTDTPEAKEAKELALVGKVELRIALTDTDTKLELILKTFSLNWDLNFWAHERKYVILLLAFCWTFGNVMLVQLSVYGGSLQTWGSTGKVTNQDRILGYSTMSAPEWENKTTVRDLGVENGATPYFISLISPDVARGIPSAHAMRCYLRCVW